MQATEKVISLFDGENGEIVVRLVVALLIGAAIGAERSYRSRPAGFRTHALVCMASSLLMLIVSYEHRWAPDEGEARITLDPTRMAQGIMTGIGFLGAGAIIKEGVSVRGLTTAASIWVTSAIGILIGIGFYSPAVMACVLTLVALSIFSWIERRMPTEWYAQLALRFAQDQTLSETELRTLLVRHGFTLANMHYRLDETDGFFEYRMVIVTAHRENARRLAESLKAMDAVVEFRLTPTSE